MTPEQLDEIEKRWAGYLEKNEVERRFLFDRWWDKRDFWDMTKALREAQALLQSVALVCRGAKEPDQADLSVLGNVLRERDEARARLSNLLARIHRDGGHYEVENGTAKAVEDAEKLVIEDRQAYVSWRDTALATAQERDEARAEVERLREVVRQVHGLAEKALGEYWTVGIAAQTLREIHKLTKGEG